jgi:hypothetical protein
MQFTLEVAVLEFSFLNPSQGILGVTPKGPRKPKRLFAFLGRLL